MRSNQYFSPKYWIAHDKSSDDIFPTTMSKVLRDCEEKAVDLLGDNFYEDDKYETILISIQIVTEEGVNNDSRT